MLRNLELKAVYDSSENDLVKDLMVPLLKNSVKYCRGVGFFSSGWLTVACDGLCELADNEGVGQIVMSPIISEKDWEAMQTGESAKKDEALYAVLCKSIEDLSKTMKEEPLNALAWLIADDIIQIKFAIPKGKLSGGDFHDKFAVFEDAQGDKVAIHGSYNDSIKGTLNGESFSVFKSWDVGQNDYVCSHQDRFLRLWNDSNSMFSVYNISAAAKDKIVQLRKSGRPYKTPKKIELLLSQPTTKITLRDYQELAIQSWFNSNCCGLLEMATGAGKSLTAIFSAIRVKEKEGKLVLVVFVPFLHLMQQWRKELEKLGFNPILCSSKQSDWQRKLTHSVQDFNIAMNDTIVVVTTHKTGASESFQKHIGQIKRANILGIFDEVHGLGSGHLRNALIPCINYRLGLSATPERWYDSQGSHTLKDYFKQVCYSFPLERAIEEGYLTPYKYIPHLVELTMQEFEEYKKLSKMIATESSKSNSHNVSLDNNTRLQTLLQKRAMILNDAENKYGKLTDLLSGAITQKQDLRYTLIYCAPGTHSAYLRLVASLGVKAREFVHDVSDDQRSDVLNAFELGDIDAIVAIKCLDEGVDVPATRNAYILSSTTNPREFIQRRGRVLRKAKGKKEALLNDFIVIPPMFDDEFNTDIEFKRSILRREMPRFAEFAMSALNQFEAREIVWKVLEKYNLLHLLDLKPWEIYKVNNELVWENT